MQNISLKITRLPEARDLPLPKYQTLFSAGMDLFAALKEDLLLKPLERTLFPTGVAIALPPELEAQIRPRSGLALKHGLTVLNSPATIDSDYRGEIKVILINLGQEEFVIQRGMRVAQLIIAPYMRVTWDERENLEEEATKRQTGGFGSTGLFEA